MLGLPGNPVSALVCASIFLRPAIEKMLGIPLNESELEFANLTKSLPENDPVRRQPDITLANKILGWKPNIEQDEGLSHTIKYFSDMAYSFDLDVKSERFKKYFQKPISES